MKRFIILLCLYISFSLHTAAQSRYQKIVTFTKVWGFLKYHHPGVARGTMNWDSVYVSTIPKLGNISERDFNLRLLDIIARLGPLRNVATVNETDTLFAQNHDLNWIVADKSIRSKLKSALTRVYTYRNIGENKYIKLSYSTADYSGEDPYENLGFASANYRLLFLARFWNAINYFAPYKYEIGQHWENVLERFIPRMIDANDSLRYYKTLMQLAVTLNDGHAQLSLAGSNIVLNNLVFGKYTAPVLADIAGGKVIIRKLLTDSAVVDLRHGDIVMEVDNESIEHRLLRLGALTSASNTASRNRMITWVLFNTHKRHITLRVMRAGKVLTVKVTNMLASGRNWGDITNYTSNVNGYEVIGTSIIRIYTMNVWRGNLENVLKAVENSKAVIFDVRNYPNGNDDFYKMLAAFLPEPKPINQSLIMSVNNPSYFSWQLSHKVGGVNPSAYKGRVVILADERSQSQGEYSVMALQTIPHALTIGSQSAGADGVQTIVPLGNRLELSYSGYGIFYPDKTPTQRRGVRIDIQANKTVESVSKGEDVALNKALAYLKDKGIE